MQRARLILHPVRLRILQALAVGPDTTQGITDRLGDVPRSSIYRHLRLLLDAGLVVVAETRRVRGIDERRYALGESARLSADDVRGLGPREHAAMFETYLLTLIREFSTYLEGHAQAGAEPDLERDRVGYTESVLHVTDDEFDALVATLRRALAPLRSRGPAPGRRPRKLSVITFPLDQAEPRATAAPHDETDR